MCIHSKKQLDRYVAQLKKEGNANAAPISLTNSWGRFAGVPVLDVTDEAEVSKWLSSLKSWHSLGWEVDLSGVNAARAQLGLHEFTEQGLPIHKEPIPETYDDAAFIAFMAKSLPSVEEQMANA